METVACPDCDLLQHVPPLPPGGKARCPRCSEVIVSQRADPLNRPLALTVAAAIAFIIANSAPLMTLSTVGRVSSTTIIGGAIEMWPAAPRWVGELLRTAHLVHPWSMTEVMMLGILVALFKIAQLATVEPGIGMYAAGAFIALLSAVMVAFDPREVWMRVRWADGSVPPMMAGVAGRPARAS